MADGTTMQNGVTTAGVVVADALAVEEVEAVEPRRWRHEPADEKTCLHVHGTVHIDLCVDLCMGHVCTHVRGHVYRSGVIAHVCLDMCRQAST